MANQINAFLERLTAAQGEFNQAKVGTLGALDAVFLDVRPEVARLGQTIRVYFPDVSPFTDQQANDWNPEDINPGYVDVPFGQRPGKALLIRDFEQFQTSTDIIDQFIDPNYKRAMEYANAAIFQLCTPANFNSYPPIQTAPANVGIGDAKLAWNILTRNKVPIQSAENATLLYHPDLHANTLIDNSWYQESLVSAVIARGTRQDVAEPADTSNQAFKFTRRYDQQAATGATAALAGTIAVTNGSTAVVGTGTAFTTAVSTGIPSPVAGGTAGGGAWITVGSDAFAYPVKSVTDDTHLTLQQPYAGTTNATATYTRTTYTSVAMHRFAIALAVRPLEIVNDGHIRSRLILMRGLPMRLMLSFQHLKSGWLMTLDYGMVAKVIRPDFGVVINS